ncbi:MAG TPA: hypothetical protein ENH84_07340 [Phycisphaerae bacterium]|nr:hypothetical protein [Phycisphaerae bacterium]
MLQKTLILILPVVLLGGCGDFRKNDYPKFPRWGWWDNPVPKKAKETPGSTAAAPKLQPEDKEETAEARFLRAERRMAMLEEHRARIWPKVQMLRDRDKLPFDRQEELLLQATESLDTWYEPIPAEPPDVSDPEGTIVLIWDFMPERQFRRAVENNRLYAETNNIPFPPDITRRGLMKFVREITTPKNLNAPGK